MIELLSPVGDFECLKAAVQNGADAVYFGASSFSARAFASNFDDSALEKAISYAKLRGVKTNLTLNTLIKNDEINDAIELAKKAYEYGIDAIIVQDLGLARYLIKNFPGLAVHASTQMSVHNLEGVLELQKLGFSRVVLSRELSLQEIEHICKNSNVEIEVFAHGALCISYSGQCLFSSMIGGRSGNRGKCAQPCRLLYELLSCSSTTSNQQGSTTSTASASQGISLTTRLANLTSANLSSASSESLTSLDKGYLLSPRDLCGLDYLPELVDTGVTCLKIEGRMKTPEYVATVTRIYRKYLDLAQANRSEYKINPQDKTELLQVFNRGGFSSGHLESTPNKNLIYKNKSNNMGIYLGTISNFNNNKGHISLTVSRDSDVTVRVGDKISVENKKHETSTYTISELMIQDKNVLQATCGDKIKIGRMKGNISVGDKIYKITDKLLTTSALETLNKENRKINLNCKMIVKRNQPVELYVSDSNSHEVKITSDIIPVEAINAPITQERLAAQLSKTNNTPFHFENIEIDLDDGLYIQGISAINELRRHALSQYEALLVQSFRRNLKLPRLDINPAKNSNTNKKISVLLNILSPNFDYTQLHGIDKVYIPLKYFVLKDFKNVMDELTENFETYIYMPTIMRNNYHKIIANNLSTILEQYKIKGFVLSNIGNIELLNDYKNKYEFIYNYTLNVFNNLTIAELADSSKNTVTLSPELNKSDLQTFARTSCSTELIVYGRTPLMNSNYCLLGKSNKCYSACPHLCNSTNKFYLKDRLGFLFRVIPDNVDTITTIYNSKITSIEHDEICVNSVRIDILDESISEINNIINTVKTGKKLEGQEFTNGNFNKII